MLPLAVSLALHGSALAAFLDWRSPAPVDAAGSGIHVSFVLEPVGGNKGVPKEEVSNGSPTNSESPTPDSAVEKTDSNPLPEPETTGSSPTVDGPLEAEPRPRMITVHPPRALPPKSRAANSPRSQHALLQAPEQTPSPSSSSEATNALASRIEGPLGTATSARAIASPDSDYLAAIMAALARHKRYPDDARLRGEQGVVLVAFAVDRSGRVLSLDVRRSSGSTALDEAAEAMVRGAEPLPAAPQSYLGTRLEIVLPVSFDLH